MRAASTGTTNVETSPTAEYTPSSAPPRAGEAPASTIQRGIQVNIAYVMSEVMPISAPSDHATGERHTRASSGGATCSASRRPSALVRRSSGHSGSTASSAGSAQAPSETRQPKASAIGTATNAGSIVPSCSEVMYIALTLPMRSEK